MSHLISIGQETQCNFTWILLKSIFCLEYVLQKCLSDLLNGLFQSPYDMGKDHLPRKVEDGIEKTEGLPSHLLSMTFYKIGIHQRIKWRNCAGHKIFLYSPKIKLEDCEENRKTQWLLREPALLGQPSKIVFPVLTDEICLLCQC